MLILFFVTICLLQSFFLFEAFFAIAVQIERIVCRLESVEFAPENDASHFLVGKFAHGATTDADAVVVCGAAGRFFVFGALRVELVFDNEPALDEQFERVVHRCPADVKIAWQFFDQFVGGEVRLLLVHYLEQTKAFLRFAQVLVFEVFGQNVERVCFFFDCSHLVISVLWVVWCFAQYFVGSAQQ